MSWQHRVRLKHLFTREESHDAIQRSMTQIADALGSEPCFAGFDAAKFYKIPKGDDFFAPVDYANQLINKMYDYADLHRIWVE